MSGLAAPEPFGRLVRSIDFERVLGTRSRASSTHFAVHHLAALPTAPPRRPAKPSATDLSTVDAVPAAQAVDDCHENALFDGTGAALAATPNPRWLGAVVPKRHARRAVTRSLLKRQIRAVASRHGAALDPGLWVVRLRAPFDRAAFPSAASAALLRIARAELEVVLARAAGPLRPR